MSEYYRKLSWILSRVMDEIGVNEENVMRRRRTNLIVENCNNLHNVLRRIKVTNYMFGSQTEGTTTTGLRSDIDVLVVCEEVNIIQDFTDWVLGQTNLLMVQDGSCTPGYCKLQLLSPDVPLAMSEVPNEKFKYDSEGLVIMKNTFFHFGLPGTVQNGPALNFTYNPEIDNCDHVYALPCKQIPYNYKEWSYRQRSYDWPNSEMLQYTKTACCFVVPVSHCLDRRSDSEWRISTSLAERCFMFSLNITQLRCFVLLKMVAKTFIEPHVPDVISSYICKTLLFYYIERTSRDFWIEEHLLRCLDELFLCMFTAVQSMNCPNYFNESSNLFRGKLNYGNREQLLLIIKNILDSRGKFLLRIGYDNLSVRLTEYVTNGNLMSFFHKIEHGRRVFAGHLAIKFGKEIGQTYALTVLDIEKDVELRKSLLQTIIQFAKTGRLSSKAGEVLFPFICSYLATVEACEHILRGQNISTRCLLLYRLSLRSDVATSRLKYASFLYCTSQFLASNSILEYVERQISLDVLPVCTCAFMDHHFTRAFAVTERPKPYPSMSNLALCVMFTRSEGQCCPSEMQFEFQRCKEQEVLLRNEYTDGWMDLAVIDGLPFLYYLQYMTARHLGNQDQLRRSLEKLESCVFTDMRLGHRETAYNILGQCYELENDAEKALKCYIKSLQIRPRHNAARLHLTRMGYNMDQSTSNIFCWKRLCIGFIISFFIFAATLAVSLYNIISK